MENHSAACAKGTCSHCTCQQNRLTADWGLVQSDDVSSERTATNFQAAWFKTSSDSWKSIVDKNKEELRIKWVAVRDKVSEAEEKRDALSNEVDRLQEQLDEAEYSLHGLRAEGVHPSKWGQQKSYEAAFIKFGEAVIENIQRDRRIKEHLTLKFSQTPRSWVWQLYFPDLVLQPFGKDSAHNGEIKAPRKGDDLGVLELSCWTAENDETLFDKKFDGTPEQAAKMFLDAIYRMGG